MSTAAMHVAKTGLTAQQTKMQIIANNLANVNTTGFKSDRPNFESLLYQVTQSAGGQTADGTMLTSASAVGTGVKLLNTQKLYTQGGLMSTDNSLDLAIDGAGFFQVLMPDGQMGFTRNGTFSRNGQGTLTTSSGYVVQPEIQIPEGTNEINVSSDGIISVMLAGQSDPQEVGQIALANFVNPQGLQDIGESFQIETAASSTPNAGNHCRPGIRKVSPAFLGRSYVTVVR